MNSGIKNVVGIILVSSIILRKGPELLRHGL